MQTITGTVLNTSGTVFGGTASSGTCDPCTTSTPLPIDLISFDAKILNQTVVLKWSMASEIDHDFFTLEKSYDGSDFETTAYIQGAGTSKNQIDYSHNDLIVKTAKQIYYRLSQTDFDGSSETFDIIAVQNSNQSNKLSVFPTVLGEGHRTISIGKGAAFSATGFSLNTFDGKRLSNLSSVIHGNAVVLNLSAKPDAGVYFITGMLDNEFIESRIVISE